MILSSPAPTLAGRALGWISTTSAATNNRTTARNGPRRPQPGYLVRTTITTLSPSPDAFHLFFPAPSTSIGPRAHPHLRMTSTTRHSRDFVIPTPTPTARTNEISADKDTASVDQPRNHTPKGKRKGNPGKPDRVYPPTQASPTGHRTPNRAQPPRPPPPPPPAPSSVILWSRKTFIFIFTYSLLKCGSVAGHFFGGG